MPTVQAEYAFADAVEETQAIRMARQSCQIYVTVVARSLRHVTPRYYVTDIRRRSVCHARHVLRRPLRAHMLLHHYTYAYCLPPRLRAAFESPRLPYRHTALLHEATSATAASLLLISPDSLHRAGSLVGQAGTTPSFTPRPAFRHECRMAHWPRR